MIGMEISKDYVCVGYDDETYAVWYIRTDPCGIDSYFGINDNYANEVYYKIWCSYYWYSIPVHVDNEQ